MSNNIKGKVVVITGASSGLGEATARHLSGLGATVVLGATRTDRLKSLVEELTAQGGKALAVSTDVADRAQTKKLVDAAVQTYRRIDVMLNNAGLMPQAPLERLQIDEWDRMIDVNIKGVLYGIAAALPYMKQQKAGPNRQALQPPGQPRLRPRQWDQAPRRQTPPNGRRARSQAASPQSHGALIPQLGCARRSLVSST